MKPFRCACITAALLLALSSVGCSGGDDKKDAENKKKVERQLAQIPGFQSAAVAVKGDTLTITGVKIDFGSVWPGAGSMALEEMTAEGVDFYADTKPGVVPIAKKIVYKGYRGEEGRPGNGQGGDAVLSEAERMEVSGMRMDAGALQKVLDAKPASPAELFAPYQTCTADALAIENYRVSFNTAGLSGVVSMGKLSGGTFSMSSCEDMLIENITCSALGMEVYSVSRWTIKQVAIPDITPYLNALTGQSGYEPTPGAMPEERSFIVRGMEMQGIKFLPQTSDPATIQKLALDLDVSPDKLSLKGNMEGFVLPPSVCDMMLGTDMLQRLYGKPFEFSGKADFESVKEGAGGRMHLKALNLAEKNLGSGDIGFAAGFAKGQEDFPALPLELQLHLTSLTVNLKDTGALDLIFALVAEELKRYSPDATKESARADLVGEAAAQGMEGGGLRKVAEAFAKFLGGSGSFSFSMAPKTPVLMHLLLDTLELTPEEDLNLRVSAE